MKAYLLIFPIQIGFMQLDQLSIEHKHTNIFKVNIVANHGCKSWCCVYNLTPSKCKHQCPQIVVINLHKYLQFIYGQCPLIMCIYHN